VRRLPSLSQPSSSVGRRAKRALLTANELFRDLDDDLMAQVEAMTSVTTCPAWQRIFEPGQTGEVLFFLKSGKVQLFRLPVDGKRLILDDVKPGEFFGEMSLLGQSIAGGLAEATKDSLIYPMSRADVVQMLREQPEIAQLVVEHLAGQLQEAQTRLATMAYQRLDARLASVLLHECEEPDLEVTGLTQQDLAEMVGASRESVTRLLTNMAKSGLVEVSRHKIRILNPAALLRF
jgi:CRP/FNR family cyclic AMP-dependent transcriptional regulator